MKHDIDIHNYPKRMESTLAKLRKDPISERNKEVLFQFYEQGVLDGLSKPHIIKCLYNLRATVMWLRKDFDQITKQDIQSFVRHIQESNYSIHTKHAFKVNIKKFFKWFKGNNEEYPEEVRWLKDTVKPSDTKLPSNGDLITEEDIKKLVAVAENPRDKALVSMLYESGCRIGELASLQLVNIRFDSYGALVTVEGKTGSRQIRLISSVPYLAMWIQHHPIREKKEAPLWINLGCRNHYEFLQYGAIRMILRRLFRRAHLNKKPNPHAFRHARASFMANHLTEFQMNQYFGWIQGSDMPAIYVHLSGKETDAAILEMNGFKVDKEHKESLLKPKQCSRCDTLSGHDSSFCSKCGSMLDTQTAFQFEEARKEEQAVRREADTIMNALIKDQEIRELILRKIQEKESITNS